MIQYIACDIKDKILSLGYINHHFEYCKIIPVGTDTYPAYYVGEGQYANVFDMDVNGHSYLRKAGRVTMPDAPTKQNIKTTSCGGDDFITVKIPLRLVLTVPKSKLGDDAFSDDYLIDEVVQMLSADIDIPDVNAREINYVITSTDTDSISVWRAEVTGVKHQMNFNYSYVAVDFNAEITINPACLIDACSY